MTEHQIAATVAFAVAQLADIVSTRQALKRKGTREGNPIMARVMEVAGDRWPLVKAAVASGVVAVLLWTGETYLIWALAALTGAVAVWNTRQGRK